MKTVLKKTFATALAIVITTAVAAQEKVYPSFLTKDDVPNAVNYLPAPPDTASVLFWGDYAQYQWGKSIRNTARGELAREQAEMDCNSILRGYSSVVGIEMSDQLTPEIYVLCNQTESDVVNGTKKAKKHYNRKRPFVQFKEGTLVPEEEESHIFSGSYPSSHSATGWGIALVLVELFPEYQDAILKHGWEYGQSRVIAGYHYQSDVDAARLSASAVVARLHADQGFQKQIEKAKKELKGIRK